MNSHHSHFFLSRTLTPIVIPSSSCAASPSVLYILNATHSLAPLPLSVRSLCPLGPSTWTSPHGSLYRRETCPEKSEPSSQSGFTYTTSTTLPFALTSF